jgi:hypothetical protein
MYLTIPASFTACVYRRQQIIDRETFFEEQLEISSQSRVGEKLTELTIRKVGGQAGAATFGTVRCTHPQQHRCRCWV